MHTPDKKPRVARSTWKTAAFYDAFRPFYPLVDFFFRKQKAALARVLDGLPAGRLLDLGTGDGSSFPVFRKHAITGVDISPKMLQQARRRAPRNTQLLCADLHALPLADAGFDYVVLSHVLSTVAAPEQVLAEAARVLKPNGKLFILNHFTPPGMLGFLDKMFWPFSGIFRFRSVFYEKDLPLPAHFRKLEGRYWFWGYFGLLVCEKSATHPIG